jgi:hypothetical protein
MRLLRRLPLLRRSRLLGLSLGVWRLRGSDRGWFEVGVLGHLLRKMGLEVFVVGEELQSWGLRVRLELLVHWRVSSWDVLCLSFRKLGLVYVFRVVNWHDLGLRMKIGCFVHFAAHIEVFEVEDRPELGYYQMQD